MGTPAALLLVNKEEDEDTEIERFGSPLGGSPNQALDELNDLIQEAKKQSRQRATWQAKDISWYRQLLYILRGDDNSWQKKSKEWVQRNAQYTYIIRSDEEIFVNGTRYKMWTPQHMCGKTARELLTEVDK